MKKGSKGEFRTHFKEVIRQSQALHRDSMQILEQQLVQNVLRFLEVYSGIWGSYKALPSEASVDGVVAARSDIMWVYPKMMAGQGLEFIQPGAWQKDSRFGVLEPVWPPESTDSGSSNSAGKKIAVEQIQGLLVPGLAFDALGNRLGRGKGFYDKTLAAFEGIKVGIGFSWQISPESIPTESHDVAMNFVITDKSILRL